MCGLVGGFWADQRNSLIKVQTELKTLRHRGPDSHGIDAVEVTQDGVRKGSLVLGHTRLAILDLSQDGNQPMYSADHRYTLVYNGEIYNYKELRSELQYLGHSFRTETDTEVLLVAWQQWGLTSVKYLTGMFAFVIYDALELTLTLVRDAFGIKPLFYHLAKSEFLFSSEIQSINNLLGKKPTLNEQVCYNYFVHGEYDGSEQTFFQGIKQLSPATLLTIDLKSCQVSRQERWWRPSTGQSTNLSFEEAADKLRELVMHSVKIHLRSDVPTAVTLSGGIDSSAIACVMRHLDKDRPIHTFSFVDQLRSEEKWIDIVNKSIGATSHKMTIDEVELKRDLRDLVRTQGEPFGGTSVYAQYRLYKLIADKGFKTVLEGQGGDEIFNGYAGNEGLFIKSLIEKREYLQAFVWLIRLSNWSNSGWNTAVRATYHSTAPNFIKKLIRSRYFLSPSGSFKSPDGRTNFFSTADDPEQRNIKGRYLVDKLRYSLHGPGLRSYLRHADRSGMRWSIESRVPFLTTEIAEFALSLPESYLLPLNGRPKSLLRHALRGILPKEIISRADKCGFETDEQPWIAQILSHMNDEGVAPGKSYTSFDKSRLLVPATRQGSKTKFWQKQYPWREINFSEWIDILEQTCENS